MIRSLCLIPIVALLAACSGLGSAKSYRPQSPPEYRTAAALSVGRDVNNSTPEGSDNAHSRIRLQPSPGKIPMIGERGQEVLESNSESGAYIAFVGQVPVTQYFKVLGRADCDDWIYLQLMDPRMVRSHPEYYMGGEYPGDKAPLKCVGLFHKKYREKSDERLSGGDGVIFDTKTAHFTEVDGLTIGHKKLFMSGWSIKFSDPTPVDIEARLAMTPVSAIDVVQLKTIAYWIEKTGASQYAPALLKLLPLDSKERALNSWHGADHAILNALASVEPADASVTPYLYILEAGVARMFGSETGVTVAGLKVGNAPFIAANVLACRNQAGTAERLEYVLKNATILQHKLASAKALVAMDKSDSVRKLLNAEKLGDVSSKVRAILAGHDPYPFECPYRSNVSAKN